MISGYDLIHTPHPLVNLVSCMRTPITAGQVVKTLTLPASALPSPLIDSVTKGYVKYLQSLVFDAMIRNS